MIYLRTDAVDHVINRFHVAGISSVIDHSWSQNVVRTSVTHVPNGSSDPFLFLSHFDIICGPLLNM